MDGMGKFDAKNHHLFLDDRDGFCCILPRCFGTICIHIPVPSMETSWS